MQEDSARSRSGSGSSAADPSGGGGKQAARAEAAGVSAEAAALAARAAAHLQAARSLLGPLRDVQEPRTLQNTLEPYDRILQHLDASGNEAALLERVHPDAGVRATAERWTQEISQFATALSLDRGVFDALLAFDAGREDAATRYYVERTLRDFRRAGVDRDEPTRRRVQELNDELTLIGQEFARNIQSDRRTIRVDPPDLDGLPDDYLQAHRPGTDGRVVLSTDYPDYTPFMSYSRSGRAREELYRVFRQRGFPENLEVLQRMLERRWELARLLGYRSWAHHVTEDKMIRSEIEARDFIERIARISEERAQQDYAQLLECKRRDDPAAAEVFDWEKDFYEERVKAELFRFESQEMRPYFPYERVKNGVLAVASRLFGVEFRRVQGFSTWSPEVETWDVYEDRQRIGRFQLDMHPRADKYKHAAEFTLVNGVLDRQLPRAVLVCNFPGGTAGDPGLMEHEDVATLFHEFGHLLHSIFAGRQRWIGISGISTEWDFVEAPSQMLEEWAWDAPTLRTFARHHETGEAIPADLVQRARQAREVGKGVAVRHQMYYAMLSLALHDRDPKDVDPTQLVRELQDRYSAFRYVDETYFHLGFGHLEGYSSIYYTYMWSLVIAKDLFSQFDAADLLDPGPARRYRDAILAAGGSAPAAQLVQRFLGRPFDFDSYESWLNER